MSSRRRRKSKKQKMRRVQAYFARFIFLAIVVVAACLIFLGGKKVFTGIGSLLEKGSSSISGNSIQISSGGVIKETTVEDFDTNVYDENDLNKLVEEEISSYNEKTGNDSAVKLSKLSIKGGKATLVMEYASAEDYTAFNEITLEVKDTTEGIPADVTSVEDKKLVRASEAGTISGTAVVLNADINVIAPKKIRFCSPNVEMIDSKTAKVTAGETDAVIIY